LTPATRLTQTEARQVQHDLRDALAALSGVQHLQLCRPVRATVEMCIRLLTKSLAVIERT